MFRFISFCSFSQCCGYVVLNFKDVGVKCAQTEMVHFDTMAEYDIAGNGCIKCTQKKFCGPGALQRKLRDICNNGSVLVRMPYYEAGHNVNRKLLCGILVLTVLVTLELFECHYLTSTLT